MEVISISCNRNEYINVRLDMDFFILEDLFNDLSFLCSNSDS